MLVLTRKRNQSIVVNDNIEVTIIDIQGDQVRVGINAPKDVKVFRKEVYLEIEKKEIEAFFNERKIDTLAPVNWLTKVDLPALGAPNMATKLKRC